MTTTQVPKYKKQILDSFKKDECIGMLEIQSRNKVDYSIAFTIVSLLVGENALIKERLDSNETVYKLTKNA